MRLRIALLAGIGLCDGEEVLSALGLFHCSCLTSVLAMACAVVGVVLVCFVWCLLVCWLCVCLVLVLRSCTISSFIHKL